MLYFGGAACDNRSMDITLEERTELESIISAGYDGSLSARAQMVLWRDDGCTFAEIARRAGTTKPTAALWMCPFRGVRYLRLYASNRSAGVAVRRPSLAAAAA